MRGPEPFLLRKKNKNKNTKTTMKQYTEKQILFNLSSWSFVSLSISYFPETEYKCREWNMTL